MSAKPRQRARGFTLLEVMVALAIVAMALPAMIATLDSIVVNTGRINSKNYAHWIADNKLQEVMLEKQLENEIPKNKQTDEIRYGGTQWVVQVEGMDTALPGVHRVEVKVGQEEGNWLATLAGFVYE